MSYLHRKTEAWDIGHAESQTENEVLASKRCTNGRFGASRSKSQLPAVGRLLPVAQARKLNSLPSCHAPVAPAHGGMEAAERPKGGPERSRGVRRTAPNKAAVTSAAKASGIAFVWANLCDPFSL
jgi:hypothetical protein